MNAKQRARNRRTAYDLARHVKTTRNMQHTCENCGQKGGHWVTTRGISLAGMIAGKDDSEGYWTCQASSKQATQPTATPKMSDSERSARILEVLLEGASTSTVVKKYWMSFCGTDKPAGQQFLGVIIVKAIGMAHAVELTHRLGINPGGEVLAVWIPDETAPEENMNRLLTKQELIDLGYIEGTE